MMNNKETIKDYHCRGSNTFEIADLRCYVNRFNDSIEIALENQHYDHQRRRKLKQIAIFLSLYGIYFITSFYMKIRLISGVKTILLDLGVFIILLHMVYSTLNLIKKEKLLYCLDFGLQLQTVRFMSRTTNTFIPAAHVKDVVINEVLEDLDVHYILIIRTKGNLFKQKPIVTVFNELRPSIDCLELIYKHLHTIMPINKIS